ncbi:30S ribosomal protein S8 [candidate division WOR-3 bacterium]|uniref:Small ribosomal subunit protein uS8 n=1 Tax=candidate division WOR-3 bacterium TaxID=2052148 RepID=A0A9D5K7K4_UNCW3|nr:30S ribosomal protein S8 [candidate division WOR-3 bacterium]MBD3363798.1 30S ribosomal protein S8 [candidate division WOR-3 bacterium]
MDVIADFLTSIRNALAAGKKEVAVSSSRFRQELARILLEEGYISNFQLHEKEFPPKIVIQLKYSAQGTSVIAGLRRVSRQSRRIYRSAKDLPRVKNGLGTVIVSTSQGVMSDRQARKVGLGGEIVCEVW